MNVALVAGCAAGGLVIGGLLDTISGRIVVAAEPPAGLPTELSDAAMRPVNAPAVPVAAALATPTRPRSAGPLEIAASAVVTAALFALLALRLGAVPPLAAYCALSAGLVAASVVDVRIGIVPRSVLYPTFGATAVGLLAASAVDHHWRALAEAAIGGAAAFAIFFAIWWFFPRAMGYGDVRLAGVIGAGLGWIGFGEVYVGFLAAFVVGTVMGIAVMVAQGTGRKTRFAFGPSLAAGAAFGVLWGPWAVHLWLQHT